ncbi:MAG: 50S ribosomal protein L24 [Ignavibacteriae bacterium]|nr:50S ribosomal protein L24 [Ignavibacteriota bacterium]
MNIHKNDQVKVIAGNARGKTGKVLKVFRDVDRVIVEGVNIIKRHTKPNVKNPQGGVVQKEAPINVSNVMVICPKCGKQTRIGHKSIQDTISARKKTMRICRKCEEMF